MAVIAIDKRAINICLTCGYESYNVKDMAECRNKDDEDLETSYLKEGKIVSLYSPGKFKNGLYTLTLGGWRYICVGNKRYMRILDLFYAKPNQMIGRFPFYLRPAKIHQLCITLEVPDFSKQSNGKVDMLYSDFLLWQKGSQKDLAEAGIMLTEKEFKELTMSRWKKIFSIFDRIAEVLWPAQTR